MGPFDDLRQGSFVALADLPKGLLTEREKSFLRPGDTHLVVISHDCDIARDGEKEPYIEFLPCHLEPEDKLRIHARNSRSLQFGVPPSLAEAVAATQRAGDGPIESPVFQLDAHQKIILAKRDLVGGFPNAAAPVEELRETLQTWLAARYRRQALPDDLDAALKPLAELLNKFMGDAKSPQNAAFRDKLLGIWLRYDEVPRDGQGASAADGTKRYDCTFRFVVKAVEGVDDPDKEEGSVYQELWPFLDEKREKAQAKMDGRRESRKGTGLAMCDVALTFELDLERYVTVYDLRGFNPWNTEWCSLQDAEQAVAS